MHVSVWQEVRLVFSSFFTILELTAADDKDSLKRLNDVTIENVQNENLRLLYVAAQSADIDLKINYAIIKTMKIYTRILGTGTALGVLPTATSIHLNTSVNSVCKAIIQCFKLPGVSHRTVYEIIKRNLWDDLDHDFSVLTPNSLSAVYLTSTEVLGTALTAGLINIPLVVLVTTRLILILASDLILILARAYQETSTNFTRAPATAIHHHHHPPQLHDVENAAGHYRASSSEVHKEILDLVPRGNLMKTYRYNQVRLGLEEILHRWKTEITKDLNPKPTRLAMREKKSFSSDRTLWEGGGAEIEKMKES